MKEKNNQPLSKYPRNKASKHLMINCERVAMREDLKLPEQSMAFQMISTKEIEYSEK
jgi:hypothetical protein